MTSKNLSLLREQRRREISRRSTNTREFSTWLRESNMWVKRYCYGLISAEECEDLLMTKMDGEINDHGYGL